MLIDTSNGKSSNNKILSVATQSDFRLGDETPMVPVIIMTIHAGWSPKDKIAQRIEIPKTSLFDIRSLSLSLLSYVLQTFPSLILPLQITRAISTIRGHK